MKEMSRDKNKQHANKKILEKLQAKARVAYGSLLRAWHYLNDICSAKDETIKTAMDMLLNCT